MRIIIILLSVFLLFSCNKKQEINLSSGEVLFFSDIVQNTNGDTLYSLFIPQSFSPNGDGLNDRFEPLGKGYSALKIKIYTAHTTIFKGEGLGVFWNGRNAKYDVVAQGNYFYKITTTDDFERKERFYEGQVTVVR